MFIISDDITTSDIWPSFTFCLIKTAKQVANVPNEGNLN